MPYSRPGPGVYVTNNSGGTLEHNQAVQESNFVGVAVKQKTRGWKDGYDVQKTIEQDEDYFIITKGVVLVTVERTDAAAAAKGDAVYIEDDNNLSVASSGEGALRFGRVVEVAGERGTPAGKARIDLDLKDSVDDIS
jgi:Uncharacterized conserved protein (DUF2190)